MDMVEVIFRGEIFEEEVIFKADIIIERIEVGKIEDYGDNLGQEKEKEEVGCHLVLDRDPELVPIGIGLGVLNVENMTIFPSECPNLIPDNSDRDSDSARTVSLHLVDSDTGSDTDHYLNI